MKEKRQGRYRQWDVLIPFLLGLKISSAEGMIKKQSVSFPKEGSTAGTEKSEEQRN